jgi:putative ABC transport system permease protein
MDKRKKSGLMKMAFQLAFKNLVGAGLRTWLNVVVLSFSFVVMVFYNGMLDGWNQQAKRDMIAWQIGDGQWVNEAYDESDPFTLRDGHGLVPQEIQDKSTSVFFRQGTIYPEGRMLSVVLKGIEKTQSHLELPTHVLAESEAVYPVIIGKRMAELAKLKTGDEVLMRWRDLHGTFDAAAVTVVGIFDCDVPMVDNGQIWMDIEDLWSMTGLQGHATICIAHDSKSAPQVAGWRFDDQSILLQELQKMIEMKKYGSSVMYLLLLAIALLAIFDTQVLSIFRRQREIGTYIAMGMTRLQVVKLFTVEGSMYSILATVVGSLYGIPLFMYLSKNGMSMPVDTDDFGMAISEKLFPVYGAGMILSAIALVVISATIVSFMPARKIAKMDPVDALKGKLQ